MIRRNLTALAAVLLSLSGCGCNGKNKPRPYPAPTADSMIGALQAQAKKVQSYRAESVMDYWVSKNRVKGTVYVMGKTGSHIRFNALNPAGGSVAVDMACNGESYAYVNKSEDCQLSGPCNAQAIASLLGVTLEPDDFLRLAVGQTPLLRDITKKSLTWNGKREVLQLANSAGFQQTIELGKTGMGWDVYKSKVVGPDGKVEWTLQNKSFKTVKLEAGGTVRAPQKTRFRQPKYKADLIVSWKQRDVNIELEADKFNLELPGVKRCK